MIPTRIFSGKSFEAGKPLERSLGTHIVLELYDCDFSLLEKEGALEEILMEAADQAGLSVLSVHSHKFEPYGLTSLALIAESHLCVHTWPEFRFVAADVFVCSRGAWKAARVLMDRLSPGHVEVLEISRGASIAHKARARGKETRRVPVARRPE